jgi:hypothetical protein
MQAFVHGWLAQSERTGLPSELIIVEWNPPADRPHLRDVLHWPGEWKACEVRFIEVPPEVHRRYAHSEALPLYQMIAKNAGIRRARGQFILATNIDILFSDELVDFLAEKHLESGRMYRIDRHDVMGRVTDRSSLAEQLAYCRTHILRVSTREGVFLTTTEGKPTVERVEIAALDSGITFGPGWFAVEREFDYEFFRWSDQKSELRIDLQGAPRRNLIFDIEPGPGAGRKALGVDLLDEDGRVLATTSLTGRSMWQVEITANAGTSRVLSLHANGGGRLDREDPRRLSFRVFWCGWGGVPPPGTGPFRRGAARRYFLLWRKIQNVISKLANEGPRVTFSLLIPAAVQHAARFYFDWGGVAGIGRNFAIRLARRRKFPEVGAAREVVDPLAGIVLGNGWGELEHYRGETFRRALGCPELVLPPTSGHASVVQLLVEPESRSCVPELSIRNDCGAVVASADCRSLDRVRLQVPRRPGRTEAFRLDFGGAMASFRLFRCKLEDKGTERITDILRVGGKGSVRTSANFRGCCELVVTAPEGRVPPFFMTLQPPDSSPVRLTIRDEEGTTISTHEIDERMTILPSLPLRLGGTTVLALCTESPDMALTVVDSGWNEPRSVQVEASLHTNACGDFTLCSRQDWFDLRAYPEFDLYSMHIDSVFCYAAHFAGVRETMLIEPMRIYHIEHATGSGWTPEGESLLFARLSARGLSFMSYPELMEMIAQMRRLNSPMIFNRGDWGLEGFALPEVSVNGASVSRSRSDRPAVPEALPENPPSMPDAR